MVLNDFLGRARALKAINRWNISPKHALAMNRHILHWGKLILGCFRDAEFPDFSRFPAGSDDYQNAFFFPLASSKKIVAKNVGASKVQEKCELALSFGTRYVFIEERKGGL